MLVLNKNYNKEEILQDCTIDGFIVRLPNIQIERKLYLDIAKSIDLIGGKWNSKQKGFIFKEDPTELLEQISNGEKRNLKKEFQFFATPAKFADYLVELADLKLTDIVLEPSAGQGSIINSIHKVVNISVDYCELMELNQTFLKKISNTNFICSDFFDLKLKNKYNKIIANPPFNKNQDIDHIKEMYSILVDGGRLVSVSSKHWLTSNNKKETEFRCWLDDVNAEIYEIESGTFKESGTMIETCVIIINK